MKEKTQKLSCFRILLYFSLATFIFPYFIWNFSLPYAENISWKMPLFYIRNVKKNLRNPWPTRTKELWNISDSKIGTHIENCCTCIPEFYSSKYLDLSLGLCAFRMFCCCLFVCSLKKKKKSESRGGRYQQRGIVALPEGNFEIRGQHLYHLLSPLLCEGCYDIWTALSFTLPCVSRREGAISSS